MIIDSHVHCRDFSQAKKETVAHALEVARDSGLSAIFDMPNTDPPIIDKESVVARLKLAKDACVSEVFYGLYIGLTANPEQVKQAVQLYRISRNHGTKNIVGFKLYAGQSVGNLAVPEFEDQSLVYAVLANEGYDGVLVVHAEKESEFQLGVWNYQSPISHCFARPEKAEIASVQDQIILAQMMRYKGKLHIPHISSPAAVSLISEAKQQHLDISCSVCPHHFLFDWTQMNQENGLLWKMNPPLRESESRKKILDLLKEGDIDWIETDHAPHLYSEKIGAPYMSGIPGLPWWPLFIDYLRKESFSDARIRELTFDNIAQRFDIDIPYRRPLQLVDRRADYAFNPYRSIESLLR